MKKAISFALVLAVLLTAFVTCFTTASAETEKKFVVDGNLDVWYLSNEETPDDDMNYYHYVGMDAYNKDPSNGNGVYFFDGAETTAEVYMAYDDTYVYVYVKCWDDDIAIHKEDNNVSHISDSIEVWFDPDPNSQTVKPDGTPKPESEIKSGWNENTPDPEQGDNQFRMRAADFAVGDMHNVTKPNYGGVGVVDWFNNPENLCGFYFENEPVTVPSGEEVSSGYGLEVRIPRYDVTGGNAFRVNVACNNRCEEVTEWYALAMGSAWWQNYATANEVIYAKNNPFFAQDVSKKSLYYTDSQYNAAGIAVKNAIAELPATITILEKNQVIGIIESYNALDDVQKGYVQARNFEVLKNAADTLGLSFDSGNTPNPPAPTVTLGDINNDGKINANDALMALRISVSKYEANEDEKVAADVDKDGTVGAKDALEILKYSVNKPSCIPTV